MKVNIKNLLGPKDINNLRYLGDKFKDDSINEVGICWFDKRDLKDSLQPPTILHFPKALLILLAVLDEIEEEENK